MPDPTVATVTTTNYRIVYADGDHWEWGEDDFFESVVTKQDRERVLREVFQRYCRLSALDPDEPKPTHIERITITTTRRIERIDPEGE